MATRALNLSLNVGTFSGAGKGGTPTNVEGWDSYASIQFTGMLVGTLAAAEFKIQESNDGVHFNDVGSAVTTNSVVQLTGVRAWLRVYTTSHSYGTPAATLVGHQHRM